MYLPCVIIIYAAMLGTSPKDKISLPPSPPCFPCFPCFPCLSSSENLEILKSLKIGKYTEWFNDVHSPDILTKCEDVLDQLFSAYGCEVTEIVLPELHQMRNAHVVSVGAESLASMNPDCYDGRRIMHYHMEAFKKVDVIVTRTTCTTAPVISLQSLSVGESDLAVSGYLMRFIIAGNLLGFPAVTVPVGHDKQGLPIGLQLIGRPWAEATILRLAHAVEELCLESRERPFVFYDILKGI